MEPRYHRTRSGPYREQVGLNLNLPSNHPNQGKFHSHVMIGMMAVLPEDQFIHLIQKDPYLSELFTRNQVFGHYLASYYPKRYQHVRENLRNSPPTPRTQQDLYQTHRKLYPEQYPEQF